MKFNKKLYSFYDSLNVWEQFFLRTCCYYPPRPRRVRTPENVENVDKYIDIYESAFSRFLWQICQSKSVMDLGCGEGGYVLALNEKGAGFVLGVDIHDEFRFAKQEAVKRNLRVDFIHGTTEAILDNSMDVVISHDSFEHFSEPEKVLKEMVRVAKPGGIILIKFGPPWMSPWGRHMSGTIRRDRPWIHLIVPEKIVMHCYSVYHNLPIIAHKYRDIPGGLNKMTITRFKRLLMNQPGVKIKNFKIMPIYGFQIFTLPVVNEFFAGGVLAEIQKTG